MDPEQSLGEAYVRDEIIDESNIFENLDDHITVSLNNTDDTMCLELLSDMASEKEYISEISLSPEPIHEDKIRLQSEPIYEDKIRLPSEPICEDKIRLPREVKKYVDYCISRWKFKKPRRNFRKRILYETRSNFASSRQRIGGRFIKSSRKNNKEVYK
jgi:hypothetical protein